MLHYRNILGLVRNVAARVGHCRVKTCGESAPSGVHAKDSSMISGNRAQRRAGALCGRRAMKAVVRPLEGTDLEGSKGYAPSCTRTIPKPSIRGGTSLFGAGWRATFWRIGYTAGHRPVGLDELSGGFIAICCPKGNSPTVYPTWARLPLAS